MLCRLKQLGLSAAGNKKDLQARLEQHTASCTAGPQQPAASTAQPVVAGASIKTAPNSKVPAGTGVFKAQKRKNFVRINLKVSRYLPSKGPEWTSTVKVSAQPSPESMQNYACTSIRFETGIL